MPTVISNVKLYTTKEACAQIGRSKDAVLRWIRLRLIEDVKRDNKNNRIWTDEDIRRFILLRNEMNNKKLNMRKTSIK